MSKIDDLMDSLQRVIGGNDRSDTPQLRKIAATYSAACADVATKLEECRTLMSAGLLLDAKNIDRSMTPSLSERARSLALSDKEEAQWQDLCRLYGYSVPVAIDMETVRRLNGAFDEETGSDSGRLIMRWRKIARAGSSVEKIELLRRIIRAVPENNAIWRDNLRQVEQQFVAELLKEIPKVLQLNDSAKIVKIFDLLSDPELSVKVPEESLAKLRPVVNEVQKKELAGKLQKQLEVIAAAYSAMDEIGLREALAEYDRIASHPLYAPSPEEARQIREVRAYLEECRRRAEEKEKAKRESAELMELIKEHGPLDKINMLYESLRQLDVPLPKTLAELVDARRLDERLEAERNYKRRTLLAVLSAILLLAGGALAVLAVNIYSENKNTADAWEKQLAEENPADVLAMYEKVKAEKPRLLKFGRLRALQMEAERMERERQDNETRSLTLLTEAEAFAVEKDPDLNEFAKRVRELEKLPPNALTPESEKRLRRVSATLRALELQFQQKLDQDFRRQWSEFSARCSAWEKAVRTPESNLDLLEGEWSKLEREIGQFFQASDKVSAAEREARKEVWTERAKTMSKLLADEREYRAYWQKLTAPKTFRVYLEALNELPTRAPQEAVGRWKAALAMLPVTRALALSADFGSFWESRAKFDEKAREILPFARTTVFVNDVRALYPADFSVKLTRQEIGLAQRLCNVPDCYELVLEDSNQKRYYFYAAKPPKREEKRSSPAPKSIRMDIFYKSGSQETVPLLLRVEVSDCGSLALKPHQFTALSLPAEMNRMVNVDLSSKIFPQAEHVRFVSDLQKELKTASTPETLEKTVLTALDALQKKKDMNLLLRASLMRQLIDMLAAVSDFYTPLILPLTAKLDGIALGHFDQWMIPNAEAQFPETAELRTFLDGIDFARLQQARMMESELFTAALERSIAPVGVVIPDHEGTPCIHWFEGFELCREAWFIVPKDKAPAEFVMMPRSLLESGGRVPATWRSLAAVGTVVFAPCDSRDTPALAERFAERARKIGIAQLDWPESWPVNCRGGQKGGK